MALVDIEQSVFTSLNTTPAHGLGNIYHGNAVRRAVSLLPLGKNKDNSDSLSYGHIVHVAAWLFGGDSGGLLAESHGTAGVSVNDVAVLGAFCFEQTMQLRDFRLHVSYGKTLFQGVNIKKFVCYKQSAYVLPYDLCMGRPISAKGLVPSLQGIDSQQTSLMQVVNLLDDIATLAIRIRWVNTRTVPHTHNDIVCSPSSYLRGFCWHIYLGNCAHQTAEPVKFDGTLRVCDAGTFPKHPERDRQGKELWPQGYIPSQTLPSPADFTGCLLQTRGCFPLQLAVVCHSGAGSEAVLQRNMCLECAFSLATEKKAATVMCG